MEEICDRLKKNNKSKFTIFIVLQVASTMHIIIPYKHFLSYCLFTVFRAFLKANQSLLFNALAHITEATTLNVLKKPVVFSQNEKDISCLFPN